MPRKPDERQQQLAWTTRRGLELKALRQIDLNDPLAKLLLVMIDLLINADLGYWDIVPDELRAMCNLPRSTFYDRQKRLQRLGLISIESRPHQARKRYRIMRGTVARLADNRSQPDHELDSEPALEEAAIAVHQPDSVHTMDCSVHHLDSGVHHLDSGVHHLDSGVHHLDCTIYGPKRTQRTPTPPSGHAEGVEVEDWDHLGQELLSLGVEHWDVAIATLRRHVSIEHARELCRHYRDQRQRGGWNAGVLFMRARRARAWIAPTDNWPEPIGPSPPSRPQSRPDLESLHGAALDSLTLSEVVSLLRAGDDVTRQLCSMATPARCRDRGTSTRNALLRLLHRQQEDLA